MNDVLEQRLAAKKRDLKQMQDFLKIDMENNINSLNYEDNAINTLLNMKKLKTEIAELELILQLYIINHNWINYEKYFVSTNHACSWRLYWSLNCFCFPWSTTVHKKLTQLSPNVESRTVYVSILSLTQLIVTYNGLISPVEENTAITGTQRMCFASKTELDNVMIVPPE